MKLKSLIAATALTFVATSGFAAELASRVGLTLEIAKQISAAAEAEAAKNKWTVAIAIVDEGGHLIHLAKIDNTQYGSVGNLFGDFECEPDAARKFGCES